MNKAVFLDRDGVINEEHGYTYHLKDFTILPDLIEALQIFQKNGFLLIVISNQSGISKDLYNQNDVEVLHKFLIDELNRNNITLSEIYYCVHHPDRSRCICRKPDSLFVEKALARFDIDASKFFFIGDKERDVEAAEKAGVKGILIESNSSLKNLFSVIINE